MDKFKVIKVKANGAANFTLDLSSTSVMGKQALTTEECASINLISVLALHDASSGVELAKTGVNVTRSGTTLTFTYAAAGADDDVYTVLLGLGAVLETVEATAAT